MNIVKSSISLMTRALCLTSDSTNGSNGSSCYSNAAVGAEGLVWELAYLIIPTLRFGGVDSTMYNKIPMLGLEGGSLGG